MSEFLQEFDNKHILIVEDEYLLAQSLSVELEAHGAHVVGPVDSVHDALLLISAHRVDGALLDINLHAETSYPIAHVLDELEVPFIFVSSMRPEDVPHHFRMYLLGKMSTVQDIAKGLFGQRPH
jgi:two-component SAPR family response regulator